MKEASAMQIVINTLFYKQCTFHICICFFNNLIKTRFYEKKGVFDYLLCRFLVFLEKIKRKKE
ncbi:hypothetical protein B9C57_10695 [Tenacibaculum maritimum]|nr:hypothetical protein B9C57_10695 [Tenacibaculum maritimum]